MTARQRVLLGLGSRCAWCGSQRQLEIDHLGNDGAAHRRALGHTKIEAWILQEVARTGQWPVDVVQLLCRACHNRKSGRVRMPTRAGTQQVNVTLPEDLSRQLAALATAPDYGSKSAVVESAVRALIEGHASDAALDALQHRLDTLSVAVTTALRELGQRVEQLTQALQAPPPLPPASSPVAEEVRLIRVGVDALKGAVDKLTGEHTRPGWKGWLHRLIG